MFIPADLKGLLADTKCIGESIHSQSVCNFSGYELKLYIVPTQAFVLTIAYQSSARTSNTKRNGASCLCKRLLVLHAPYFRVMVNKPCIYDPHSHSSMARRNVNECADIVMHA